MRRAILLVLPALLAGCYPVDIGHTTRSGPAQCTANPTTNEDDDYVVLSELGRSSAGCNITLADHDGVEITRLGRPELCGTEQRALIGQEVDIEYRPCGAYVEKMTAR
jgi:hypothetical protein